MIVEKIEGLLIEGAKRIRFGQYDDARGWFCEPARLSTLRDIADGFEKIVQVNQSYSRPRTLRGFHIQQNPPMGKLVRLLSGGVFELLLDLRRDSRTFGQAGAYHLDRRNEWVWIPPGIAHGNYFPCETTIEYLCTAEYNQAGESNICPLDTEIKWLTPIPFNRDGDLLMSDKDRDGPILAKWLGRG